MAARQKIDGALRKQIDQWFEQDGCLKTLFLLTHRAETSDPVVLGSIDDFTLHHVEQCGDRCFVNVRIALAKASDPAKRKWYRHVLRDFMLWLFRHHACPYRGRPEADGFRFQAKFPPSADLPNPPPFSAVEFFIPNDPNARGYVILDAPDQATFDQPGALHQHLDVIDTQQVKSYPAEAGRLHWRLLFDLREPALLLRFNGEIKTIAKGWSLFGRYGDLARKRVVADPIEDGVADDRRRPTDNTADAVELLRKLALSYNERSWFAGYVAATSGFRKTDQHRRVQRARNRRGDPPRASAGEESVSSQAAADEDPALPDTMGGPASVAERIAVTRLDVSRLLPRLVKDLRPVDLQMLALNLERKTNEEIGLSVGLARETVNKRLQEIRRLIRGSVG